MFYLEAWVAFVAAEFFMFGLSIVVQSLLFLNSTVRRTQDAKATLRKEMTKKFQVIWYENKISF